LLTAGFVGAGSFAIDGLLRRSELLSALAENSLRPSRLGSLAPTPSINTNETVLAVPHDFQYTVLGKTGARMSDGHLTPAAHDGMAAFQVKGELRLVRNHEVNIPVGREGAAVSKIAYDPMAAAGTTTLVINPRTREIEKDFISLSGTLINCAGGPTPWNSWISCEETVLGPRKFKNDQNQDQGGFSKPHGYCFEVSALSDGPVKPIPLKAMGRFVHEALAVDPKTGIVYLTEDKPACGFYRFIPKQRGKLVRGGRLQMLAIKDHPKLDARKGQKENQRLAVKWVDIPNPDPPEADVDALAVFKQGLTGGGTIFSRLEGCLYGRGKIFFTSTDGGDRKLGQVWEFEPGTDKAGGTLTLLLEPKDAAVLNMPDNLCLTRSGGLMICEDNAAEVHLQMLTQAGDVVPFAKNVMPGYHTREFAGVTFSPDGQTLFVNIQTPGVTLAIWGPFDRL
jgi:secreted PhoX family phosphatase